MQTFGEIYFRGRCLWFTVYSLRFTDDYIGGCGGAGVRDMIGGDGGRWIGNRNLNNFLFNFE